MRLTIPISKNGGGGFTRIYNNIILNNINNNKNKYKLISQYINKDDVDFYFINLFKYLNNIYKLDLIIQDDKHIIINNIHNIYIFIYKNINNKDFCYHKDKILKIHPVGQIFIDAIESITDGNVNKKKLKTIRLENEFPSDDIYINKFNEIIKQIKIKKIDKEKIKLSYKHNKLALAKFINKNILQLFKIDQCFNLYLSDLEAFYLDISNKIYKLK